MMAMLATRQEPGRLRQVELASPALGEGDVLVSVAAASVNRLDLVMLDEWSGRSRDSAVPGCDAAGIIVGTCGIVGGLAVGDRVVTIARPGAAGSATYADLVSVPAAQVVRVPDGLELAIAAALPLAGLSAYQALYAIMPEAGETLLIQGASGGVGTFAIQLACRGGARVIAGASVAAAPLCRALGAELVVDSRRGDAAQLLRQHLPRGCNAVLSLMDDCAAFTPAAFMSSAQPPGNTAVRFRQPRICNPARYSLASRDAPGQESAGMATKPGGERLIATGHRRVLPACPGRIRPCLAESRRRAGEAGSAGL